MANSVAYDAKMDLADLLDRVEQGEQITITRHGVPVAMLVPVEPPATIAVAEVIVGMKELRKGQRLAGQKVRGLMEEGRR